MAINNDSESTNEKIYKVLENDFQYKNTDFGILVTINTADGKEDVSLDSNKFFRMLSRSYRKMYGETAQSSKIKDCLQSYSGDILAEYARIKTSNRCDCDKDGSILIDRGDIDDIYFVISKNGLEIKENASKHFYKHSRKGEIPMPDIENGDIERIFKYCRVPENMKNIFIAYLVSLFIGNIEHPCLVLNGEQGSGKTTMSTFIKVLIDPIADSCPTLFPKNDWDLALMFQDNYLLAFDNLQTLDSKSSDRLCRIITGIISSFRKLYTNCEMIHFDLCQPIILNGIHDIVKREDMLSRCIVMKIDKPSNAGDKVKLTEDFMNDRAIILGGIFNILVEALKKYKPNSVPKCGNDIRMSSFYDYGYYICEAWKKGYGAEFCVDYIDLLEHQLKDFKKNTDLLETIKCFLEENDSYWEGVMSDLSKTLINFLDIVGDCIKIPTTPNRLSREINNLRTEFEKAGITIEMSKTRNNSRYIRLSLEDID